MPVVWLFVGCGLLPASRESVEAAVGYDLPAGASRLRLRDVNIGLRDARTEATFALPTRERAQLQAVLPCALEDCGGSWRCFVEGGHDEQVITLVPRGETDDVEIETTEYDNNLPQRVGGCGR